jgi:hypothetical protein
MHSQDEFCVTNAQIVAEIRLEEFQRRVHLINIAPTTASLLSAVIDQNPRSSAAFCPHIKEVAVLSRSKTGDSEPGPFVFLR